jgi:hypothetical protein
MGKREPQIILKTDKRNIHLELGRDGKFAAKSTGWDEKSGFPRRRQARSRGQARPLGGDPPSGGAAEARTGAPLLPD